MHIEISEKGTGLNVRAAPPGISYRGVSDSLPHSQTHQAQLSSATCPEEAGRGLRFTPSGRERQKKQQIVNR
ncbi:hypothetical protein chiPu_0002629 [Chiloscyllium punctatum]|uniref:Uncharacterized protein n=1 Tax=Chiloscyllium punctatum TaxID=137246 RepID=A0A401S1G5_CHIPU|nr:hypothetical protein [Chiloscyllium punctatum]